MLTDARRIWYWDGAASLSQLAMSGTSPESCKFPEPVTEVCLTEAIGLSPLLTTTIDSIKGVPIWKCKNWLWLWLAMARRWLWLAMAMAMAQAMAMAPALALALALALVWLWYGYGYGYKALGYGDGYGYGDGW